MCPAYAVLTVAAKLCAFHLAIVQPVITAAAPARIQFTQPWPALTAAVGVGFIFNPEADKTYFTEWIRLVDH